MDDCVLSFKLKFVGHLDNHRQPVVNWLSRIYENTGKLVAAGAAVEEFSVFVDEVLLDDGQNGVNEM